MDDMQTAPASTPAYALAYLREVDFGPDLVT